MKLALIATALATVVALPVSAQIASHTTRAAFDTAAGTTTTEDFETCTGTTILTAGLSAANPSNCTGLQAGITYSPDPGFNLYIAAPTQSANTTTALGVDFPNGGNNRISFAGGSTAFGADFNQNFGGGSQSGSPVLFTLDAFDAMGGLLQSFTFNVDSGSSTFFGITSSTAFASVWVRQAGGFAVIDNVSFASQGVVPEPASWAMLIAGFGLVGAASRRRRTVIA